MQRLAYRAQVTSGMRQDGEGRADIILSLPDLKAFHRGQHPAIGCPELRLERLPLFRRDLL